VKPILEYGATTWALYIYKDITIVEKVQRHAAKFVFEISANKLAYTT